MQPRFAIALAAWIMAAAPGAGQVGAGAPLIPHADCEGHGWIVLPREHDNNSAAYALLLVPPRGERTLRADTAIDAPPGSVVYSGDLNAVPDALCAWGRDVWAVMPLSSTVAEGKTERFRRVFRAGARVSGFGSRWLAFAGGAFDRLPPLQGSGEVELATGSPIGPVLVVNRATGRAMLALLDEQWTEVPLPQAALSESPFALAATESELIYYSAHDGNVIEHRAPLPESGELPWVASPPIPLPQGAGEHHSVHALSVGRATYVLTRDRTEAVFRLLAVDDGSITELASAEGVRGSSALLMNDPGGRVRLAVFTPFAGPKRDEIATLEQSFPGRFVEYEGPALDATPSPILGFRIYIIAMILTTALLVFVIVRRSAERKPAPPK